MEDFDNLSLQGKCEFVEYVLKGELEIKETELAIEKAKRLIYTGYDNEDRIKGLELVIQVYNWLLSYRDNG